MTAVLKYFIRSVRCSFYCTFILLINVCLRKAIAEELFIQPIAHNKAISATIQYSHYCELYLFISNLVDFANYF